MPKGIPKSGKRKTRSDKKDTKVIFKRVKTDHYEPLMEVLNQKEKELKEASN